MKYIKSYKLFESLKEGDIKQEEIDDIFIGVQDSGLKVDNIYIGNALSIGDREIVTDHREFETILGPDGHYVGSYKSFSIRLKAIDKNDFRFDDDLFAELKSSIGHVESEFNLQLGSIYLRTFDGVWFNNVDTMEKYINDLPFAKRSSLRHVSYLDLTFRVLESTNESATSSILDSIVDDVKDILKDLEDDYEIDVDTIVGQYRKSYSGGNPVKSWNESDDSELKNSINIDLKDNKNNFFRFNDHILPTIKKLRSFLSEYDLNIDIELVTGKTNNEFYSLDEFIEEYGSEEFYELGIIIY